MRNGTDAYEDFEDYGDYGQEEEFNYYGTQDSQVRKANLENLDKESVVFSDSFFAKEVPKALSVANSAVQEDDDDEDSDYDEE